MAISFGSNLVHGSAQKGLVDSDQVFGSFKTHVGSLADFRNFVDDYTDNGTDYFNLDLWGKFKPYATLVYVSNGNALNVLDDVTNLVEGTDYFVGVDSDGANINIAINAVNATPKVFMYTGNADYATTQSYDSNITNRFTVTGTKATPMAWTDFAEYVGGTTTDLSGLSITQGFYDGSSADLPEGVDAATALSHIAIGDVSGNGTDGFVIEFPTNNDIRTAFTNATSTSAQAGDINFVDNADGTMHIRVAADAALGVASVAATGALSSATLAVSGASSLQNVSASGTLTTTSGAVTLGTLANNDGATVVTTDASGVIAAQTPSDVFGSLYPNVTETVAGTANQILVDGDNNATPLITADKGDITLSLANQLVLAGAANGTVTIGPAGSGTTGVLTVQGSTTIQGDLTVNGDFVQTSSQTTTFTDNLLSLNILRDDDDNIADTATSALTSDSGIEVFHGATTYSPAGGGADLQVVDEGWHSRPSFFYDYGTGQDITGLAGQKWGVWKLINYYTNPSAANDGSNVEDNLDHAWNAVVETVLTDVSVALAGTISDAATGVNELHDPALADSNIKHLASAYTLITPVSSDETGDKVYTDGLPSGQAYARHFGRVSTNLVTYGVGTNTAPTDAAIEVTHKLNSNEVMCLGLVVNKGSGSQLPLPGNMIFPESRQGVSVNSRKVKVQGVVNGDQVKFIFIG